MARRRRILRRKRFFVGCEGESERGYAAFLQALANELHLSIHLDTHVVHNAGNPLALVKQTLVILSNGERCGRPAYRRRFLLLDTDLLGQDPADDAKMNSIAQANNLVLVRQKTCFEAMLLRHVVGKETHQPPTSAKAMSQLKTEWPEYRKGTAGQDLIKKFSLDDVHRAALQPIQKDLRGMLIAIGLLQ